MNKVYNNGDLVYIQDGAGLPPNLRIGRIVGIMIMDQPVLGRCYAVDVGEVISSQYKYQVVGIFDIFLRPPVEVIE